MYTHQDHPIIIDDWSKDDLIEQNKKDWKDYQKQLVVIKQLKEENKQLKEELIKVKEQARFVLLQNQAIKILTNQVYALQDKLNKYKRIINDREK